MTKKWKTLIYYKSLNFFFRLLEQQIFLVPQMIMEHLRLFIRASCTVERVFIVLLDQDGYDDGFVLEPIIAYIIIDQKM